MKPSLSSLFCGALTATTLFFSAAISADTESDIQRVRVELSKMMPVASDAEIVASPAEGVYRMDVQGNYAYAYVKDDFILLGDLFNTKDQVNLGEEAAAVRMASIIDDVPMSKMIVYGPKDAKRHITVFTDIDCGYCRKLHQEVPDLNAAGIQVRYMAYPRAGVGSKSHKKYVSVWCSDDQQAALTAAKAGESVPTASCENPIAESFNIGRKVGVKGTPTIVLDTGKVTPGYVPSAELIRRMGIEG